MFESMMNDDPSQRSLRLSAGDVRRELKAARMETEFLTIRPLQAKEPQATDAVVDALEVHRDGTMQAPPLELSCGEKKGARFRDVRISGFGLLNQKKGKSGGPRDGEAERLPGMPTALHVSTRAESGPLPSIDGGSPSSPLNAPPSPATPSGAPTSPLKSPLVGLLQENPGCESKEDESAAERAAVELIDGTLVGAV